MEHWHAMTGAELSTPGLEKLGGWPFNGWHMSRSGGKAANGRNPLSEMASPPPVPSLPLAIGDRRL